MGLIQLVSLARNTLELLDVEVWSWSLAFEAFISITKWSINWTNNYSRSLLSCFERLCGKIFYLFGWLSNIVLSSRIGNIGQVITRIGAIRNWCNICIWFTSLRCRVIRCFIGTVRAFQRGYIEKRSCLRAVKTFFTIRVCFLFGTLNNRNGVSGVCFNLIKISLKTFFLVHDQGSIGCFNICLEIYTIIADSCLLVQIFTHKTF